MENPSKLNFLGAGYPLIFNYYLYCMIILSIFFLSFGVYAIYSNTKGNFCHETADPHNATETESTNETHHRMLILANNTRILSGVIHECAYDWINYISLANKLDNEESHDIQGYFSIVTELIIIIILMYFRKHQRRINATVDEQTNTPSDYTIIITGIPTNLQCDYTAELKNLFENYLKNGKSYKVEKVNLVFNIHEIEKMEHQLKKNIEKKKKILEESNFDYDRKDILELEKNFEEIEEKVEKLKEHYVKTNEKFAGIAFISFSTEDGNSFSKP